MNKKHIFFFTFLLSGIATLAQVSQYKAAFSYHQMNNDVNALEVHENQFQSVLVRGNPDQIRAEVALLGGKFKYSHNDICAVSIPKSKIETFVKRDGIRRVEQNVRKSMPLLDTALINNDVVGVHKGWEPFKREYDGEGVVIGIIDDGIDINHFDFRNEDSSTRILYIWDQQATTDTSAPQPYGYGKEWDNKQIDSGVCTHTEYGLFTSHGMNVAGIAVGNGSAVGNYKGVAPKSDIIIVATNYDDTSVVDAVDYIFKKADSLNKPCVVNMSLGNYFGSHDGKDLYAQAINNIVAEKPGRVVVCAAGNGRKDSMHLRQEVTSDTNFTWFKYNYISPILPQVWFFPWVDTADFDSVSFSVGVDNANYEFQDATPFRTVKAILYNNIIDTLYDTAANIIGQVYSYAEYANDSSTYSLNMAVLTDSVDHLWRFSTTGKGSFDVWSSASFIGTSNMVRASALPSSAQMPDIVNYTVPDNLQTITSGWTCAPNVITVANYNNRGTYLDVDSLIQSPNPNSLPPGSIAPSSSIGPTRDGRTKPDIAASGNTTISAGRPDIIATLIGSAQGYKVGFGGQHMRNGGTSMAAPVVSGIAALYLQKNPTATYLEVKEALLMSAKQDQYTGDTINDSWGHGKVNAFETLADDTILGCTDTAAFNYDSLANVDNGNCIDKVLGCTDSKAFNYNPLANVDDSSCVPTILGCTDSTALNYDSAANTDDGSCTYVGIAAIEQNSIFVHPNPFKDQFAIYNGSAGKVFIDLHDITGRNISYTVIKDSQHSYLINLNSAKGIYYLLIKNEEGEIVKSMKVYNN